MYNKRKFSHTRSQTNNRPEHHCCPRKTSKLHNCGVLRLTHPLEVLESPFCWIIDFWPYHIKAVFVNTFCVPFAQISVVFREVLQKTKYIEIKWPLHKDISSLNFFVANHMCQCSIVFYMSIWNPTIVEILSLTVW